MGTTKSDTGTNQNTSYTATPAEQAMQNIELQQYQTLAPYQTEMQKNAYNLGNQLLTSFGDQNSQMWKSLIGGISNEQTQSMVNEQLNYLKPQLQSQGIYDSGLAATSQLKAASNIANQNAQFNVGTLQNALNLALSGQAQIQQPTQASTNTLASQLSGLRSVSSTGSTSTSSNPFLTSLYGNLGSSLGNVGLSKTGWSWGGR